MPYFIVTQSKRMHWFWILRVNQNGTGVGASLQVVDDRGNLTFIDQVQATISLAD